MRSDDFFRVHDGRLSWSFGRCRRHDNEWLVVEIFGKGEPSYGWAPINRTVVYPYAIARDGIEKFLSHAEVWP